MPIKINGMITNNDDAPIYRDWLGMDVVSPQDVEDALQDYGEEDIDVNVNSFGGEVDPAAQIYTMLRNTKNKVIVNIESSAYSAGTIIAMAGDVVRISPSAQMMIHKASSGAMGNSDDLQKGAQMLDSTDKTIANVYATKTGKPIEDFLALMAKETWLSPQDAIDLGLADEIMEFNAEPVTNSSKPIIAYDKVQKIKGLVEENKELKQNKENSQPEDTLYQQKLAIFLDKKESQNE